jgi:ligand-binding sensor domain-containing protein
VRTIFEDRAGTLWIGANGLNCFAPANERFYRYQHDPGNPNTLSSNRVTAICEDSTGALWIGTDGGGLNRMQKAKGKMKKANQQPSSRAFFGWAPPVAA